MWKKKKKNFLFYLLVFFFLFKVFFVFRKTWTCGKNIALLETGETRREIRFSIYWYANRMEDLSLKHLVQSFRIAVEAKFFFFSFCSTCIVYVWVICIDCQRLRRKRKELRQIQDRTIFIFTSFSLFNLLFPFPFFFILSIPTLFSFFVEGNILKYLYPTFLPLPFSRWAGEN